MRFSEADPHGMGMILIPIIGILCLTIYGLFGPENHPQAITIDGHTCHITSWAPGGGGLGPVLKGTCK